MTEKQIAMLVVVPAFLAVAFAIWRQGAVGTLTVSVVAALAIGTGLMIALT